MLSEKQIKEGETLASTALKDSKQTQGDIPTTDLSKKSMKIEIATTPPTMFVWCTREQNEINIIDIETKKTLVNMNGFQTEEIDWTHVKEILNTNLLVSLSHSYETASMEIFDFSKKGILRKIYSSGELLGISGNGDVTYNSRRNFLGAIPLANEVAYHLWSIEDPNPMGDSEIKLLKKSKWQYDIDEANCVTSLDFNPVGETAATIDTFGAVVISDLDTDSCKYRMKIGSNPDDLCRCRWTTNPDEHQLFASYDTSKLNILDVEKRALTLKDSILLGEKLAQTHWIDVCQNNGNLLVVGNRIQVKIFDKRESSVVKTFELKAGRVNCVRWSSCGGMLACACKDGAKLFDMKTEKVVYTGFTYNGHYYDKYPVFSACFL